MKILSVENLTKTYGEKTIFKDISFTIAEKERIGLIGVNGTGKSTLLRMIASINEPDSGFISLPNDYSISYLSQNPELNPELTVLQQVFESDAVIIRTMRQYEQVIAKLEKNPEDTSIQEELFQAQKQMDQYQAWDANANAKTILTKLGLNKFNKVIKELSGGQKKRVALAQVLIETPDLLILDEPTNHLDFASIKWLEDFLSKYAGSVLVVTHDRYFLDSVSNKIFELDGGHLYSYKGNYQSFIEAKALRQEEEKQTAEKQKNLYRRELAWIRRGAKARSTKQKARIQRFENIEKGVNQVTSSDDLTIGIAGSRLGKQVFEFENAGKKFDSKIILNHFNYLIKPGDRIGIVGKNGSGKSTLLNILGGKSLLDEGALVTGQTVNIAYYTQEHEEMNESQRMIEYIRESAEVITTEKGEQISAAQMLERFLFPMHSHGTLIKKLSGGEKRRLFLLKLLMKRPNVLLLDEPTNDLDTETLTVLEDYILEFAGVVITVSHDRYFLDKVATQLLIFQGNGVIGSYYGEFTEYLEMETRSKINEKKVIRDDKKIVDSPPKKKKMTYKEKIEWEEIEDKIEQTELRLEEVEKELSTSGSNFEAAQNLMKESEELNSQLEYLIERWTYLSEIAGE
ncbi:ATP-binding cassette subfamily F protein uup [Bacillus pakistanensis]|uniref:ATP-binding cassette subfamily F protein uup n=1 Tax=Rossellomorea pakistanensis TaxID=992288 RepID=A0ABS2N8S9_9BACI|nr:ABC-F family ATP-binding cassette domain-containing protein [Bacillus pakistanensis]MBM7584262.1 ATP-binding cassette subfamily F protein uup [Bacillus pakistanensis]